MSDLSLSAAPSFTTTLLFNDAAAAPTAAPSAAASAAAAAQGSITLYQSDNCSSPLSDAPTPLMLGECRNTPFSGIGSVSIASLPSCADNGTPLLIVSDQADCQPSTNGSTADSGVPEKCLGYGGVDIGSMGFTCYGDGVVSVTATASAAATSSAAPYPGSGSGNGDSGDSMDCCCVVM